MTVSLYARPRATNSNATTDQAATPPLCADDPQSVIWQFLTAANAGMGARDALFLWIVGLPASSPTREAARNVLEAYHDWFQEEGVSRFQEMQGLLGQVVDAPMMRASRRNAARKTAATYH